MRTRKSSPGTLADESQEAVSKLLNRSNKRSSRGQKKINDDRQNCDLSSTDASQSKINDIQDVDLGENSINFDAEVSNGDGIADTLMNDKLVEGSFHETITDNKEDMDDSDWEDGSIPTLDSVENHQVTIEFNETPDSAKRKPVRRATTEEKELAEIIHKVHLLCLLGRGRLIDRACDDPLIQAALLSLLPKNLLNVSKAAKLTVKDLYPFLSWFQDNFHVRIPANDKRSFRSSLAFALESREGCSDEIAALSVALFRALGLTTRFLSILDVSSLKPDGDKSGCFSQDGSRSIFSSLTPMVVKQNEVSVSPLPGKSFTTHGGHVCETSWRGSSSNKENAKGSSPQKDCFAASELNEKQPCSVASEQNQDTSVECVTENSQGLKRKGDIEFELQMEMALSATAIANAISADNKLKSSANNPGSNLSNLSLPLKKTKRILSEESPASHGVSTAIGSKRAGSPLYWAEVYCSGENMTGKWVHVDVVNSIIDGEHRVEALAAACKVSLRYVVAFAGNGAKDVTRRYCVQWHKIASKRVHPIWWDAVLAPLRALESRATSGEFNFNYGPGNEQKVPDKAALPGSLDLEIQKVSCEMIDKECASRNPLMASRSSLEDIELETRALTEPLPKNQQAYRTHRLYAIEKWLTKNQVLHPKGPVLGFCSGHAVYPRTCVQTLKTKERWLREALQVKEGELPVKEVKHPGKLNKVKSFEDDDDAMDNLEGTLKLYGKWQLEPLQLPHAENGRVPKNERGQVDVWSEKCLPPGTVHLRFPRVFSVAKRLEIDYAPAMVGFEYKNGQSYPIFEGIVVCAEFKDVILEAYIEEQKQKEAEEKRKNEIQAINRWYQLLSSIVTRQRIKSRYGNELSTSLSSTVNQSTVNNSAVQDDNTQSLETEKVTRHKDKAPAQLTELEGDHRHEFVTTDQCFVDDSLVRIKRCHCGFSLQVEDL